MSYFPERRSPRIEFQQLPVVFSLRLPEAAGSDKPLRLEARNISRDGIKFLCNHRFPIFELLQLNLFEKATGKPLPAIQGKVVRVEEIDTGFGERTYGIAMEFVSGADALTSLLPESTTPPSGK